jgi:hypothetical protein
MDLSSVPRCLQVLSWRKWCWQDPWDALDDAARTWLREATKVLWNLSDIWRLRTHVACSSLHLHPKPLWGVFEVEKIRAAIAPRRNFYAGIRDAARQAYMVTHLRHRQLLDGTKYSLNELVDLPTSMWILYLIQGTSSSLGLIHWTSPTRGYFWDAGRRPCTEGRLSHHAN